MVEKFDKKKAEKIIEDIKNDKINPFWECCEMGRDGL